MSIEDRLVEWSIAMSRLLMNGNVEGFFGYLHQQRRGLDRAGTEALYATAAAEAFRLAKALNDAGMALLPDVSAALSYHHRVQGLFELAGLALAELQPELGTYYIARQALLRASLN